MMKNSGFAVFFFCCFVSVFLIISVTARNNGGVYIVYTGAAATGFPSDHILSSSSLESWKDRVIHRYNNAFSGFAARLTEEEAKSIAQRPEVVSVFPDRILQLHTTRSWDFLKELSGTTAGFKPRQIPKSKSSEDLSAQDVIIGIFDTGIWPEAKSFNDEGIGPIPKRWKGNCIGGHDFKSFKCNRKLIGARNYLTNDSSTSARDHDGHGTHVAAIAAGRAVPGASYLGHDLGTARGGSPGSRIAVYRVCKDLECEGSAVLKAFDDAIADGVDVISASLGHNTDDFTIGLRDDPISIGAFHAFEKGIIVISSSGDLRYSIPTISNVAPWILTVGATTIDRFFETDVVLNLGGNNKTFKGGGIHDANFPETPFPLIDGSSAAKSESMVGYYSSNCYADAIDGEKVKGKMVICGYSDLEQRTGEAKLEAITSLGGIGVIHFNEYRQLFSSSSTNNRSAIRRGSSPLVAVIDDENLLYSSSINSSSEVTVLRTVVVANYTPAPAVAFFSGYGPIFSNDYLLKPDVVAPGVDILSAWPSNETDQAFNLLSGTSMACPHVTGIAALVKSQYPSWSPSAIKSAIMTTTRQTNNLNAPIKNSNGDPASHFQVGAGEVTLSGPFNPGLVYETEIMDYLLYFCNYDFDESTIRLISPNVPANFSCPKSSSYDLQSNLNYPSIATAIPSDSDHTPIAGAYKTVKRMVTNVGDEEETVYRVSVERNRFLKVRVRPATLKFTRNQKKLSYEVTFRYVHDKFISPNASAYQFGSITWSNEKYRVRIPFVVV